MGDLPSRALLASIERNRRRVWALCYRMTGNRAVIRPIPVHADLAGRVSTTRETVARVLNDLARKRIVQRESGGLAILDVRRLSAMVEEFRGD